MGEETKMFGACCGCIAFITTIVLIACSFKTQTEQDVCLEYHSITRVVNPTPKTVPGLKALGPFADLLCYPKTVQQFEYASKSGRVLNTRTKEGLNIGIDITVEYTFNLDGLKSLFDLVGATPSPKEAAENLYKRVALSTIINVASLFPANSFMSEDRGNVSSTMTNAVSSALSKYYASLRSLQMRNIKLDSIFTNAIDTVLQEKLTQARLTQKRQTDIEEVIRVRLNRREQIARDRQQKLIEASKQLELEVSERTQKLVVVLQDANKERERSSRDRTNRLTTVAGDLRDAVINRDGVLQRGITSADALAIRMADEIAISSADATVTVVSANAEEHASITAGQAQAQSIELFKAAETKHYKSLLNDAGMSKEDVLRHNFLSALESQTDSQLFLGYKKVSMFAETGKSKPLLKDIIPSRI